MEYLPWIIVAVLAILVIVLLVAYSKAKKENRLLTNQVSLAGQMTERLQRYYVDEDDRSALATFAADHLDDTNHPNRSDVVRILAKWGSTR